MIVRAQESADPFVDLTHFIPSVNATACLSESAAKRLMSVPLALRQETASTVSTLVVATVNPADDAYQEKLKRQLGRGVSVSLLRADSASIESAINKCYEPITQGAALIQACSIQRVESEFLGPTPNRVIRLVEALLLKAVLGRASDIHISAEPNHLGIRFRVDGVLSGSLKLKYGYSEPVSGRLKVLAMMDIAESRMPQDGQFSCLVEGEVIDFRVSTFPTVNGENIVLRVLPVKAEAPTLSTLGVKSEFVEALVKQVQKPQGLIIFCGPTGSGKSTSLHALLAELDRESLNIMTLEDPVERQLSGIRQTNIDAARAFGFVEGIRALLRQDPDVLLIGEVRDAASGQMMLRAVMTGHRVLTTVHAVDVFGALDRLLELGVSSELLSANLACIVSQRLVRLSCQCQTHPTKHCDICAGSGFYGRRVRRYACRL